MSGIMKIVVRVRVEAAVHPTESVAKVKAACLNLFPDLTLTEAPGRLVGEGADLEHFRQLVRNQKIRDTARSVLIRGRQGTTTSFWLNKPAASVGRLNFGTSAPLGNLEVTVEDEDLDAWIDHAAESTVGRRLTATRDRTGGR